VSTNFSITVTLLAMGLLHVCPARASLEFWKFCTFCRCCQLN